MKRLNYSKLEQRWGGGIVFDDTNINTCEIIYSVLKFSIEYGLI
jgi:hypothetical protein